MFSRSYQVELVTGISQHINAVQEDEGTSKHVRTVRTVQKYHVEDANKTLSTIPHRYFPYK